MRKGNICHIFGRSKAVVKKRCKETSDIEGFCLIDINTIAVWGVIFAKQRAHYSLLATGNFKYAQLLYINEYTLSLPDLPMIYRGK